MGEPVIPARTRVPSFRAIERQRLNLALEAAWRLPLTLVVAPAGSGKTTLLSTFAAAEIASGRPVAWYQAESSEALPGMLRHLEQALRAVLPGLPTEWDSVGTTAAALETWSGPPAVLIIDDGHALAATATEVALEQLVTYLPSWLHVVIGSRRPPGFDLSRWRLTGQLAEIGPDQLRFRTWEVEDLFRHHYHEALLPEELAEVARRTDGWAAGLMLFHLATRGKTAADRRRVLASLSVRPRHTRDYLTRNVLADLDEGLRRFLILTSVLGRLSGPWCDELLDRTGSARILSDIEGRHLFLHSDDEGATYREHEVLRAHLEELVVEELGEGAAREHYQRAGAILERAGALPEALRAYCRSQDWASADRLLGRSGDKVFDSSGAWVEPLPAALADHDAWMLLATARRQVSAGYWDAAVASYRRGEEVAIGALVAGTCQQERFRLAAWLDPTEAVSHSWTGVVRRALARDPLGAFEHANGLDRADQELAIGLAALAAGHLDSAYDHLAVAADSLDASRVPGRVATLGALATGEALHRGANPMALDAAVDAIEAVAPPWLAKLVRTVADGSARAVLVELEAARPTAVETANPWIALLLGFLEAGALLAAGESEGASTCFIATAAICRGVGAGVLAAWAMAAASLSVATVDPIRARRQAVTAGQLARTSSCPGALALARLVEAACQADPDWRSGTAPAEHDGVIDLSPLVAAVLRRRPAIGSPLRDAHQLRLIAGTGPEVSDGRDGDDVSDHMGTGVDGTRSDRSSGRQVQGEAARGEQVRSELSPAEERGRRPPGGLESGDLVEPDNSFERVDHPVPDLEHLTGASGPPGSERASSFAHRIDLGCFGEFSLVVDGRPVDVATAKPRVRALLHRLAMSPGDFVHRDQLRSSLWPDDDSRAGNRNLQVAVSALRQLLQREHGPSAGGLIVRKGDAYALAIGDGVSDVRSFDDHVERGRTARHGGRPEDAAFCLAAALMLYHGDLLVEDGDVEWVLEARERHRVRAADTAQSLAECFLELGDAEAAVQAAERGLQIDRYRDGLWRAAIAAHERSGNRAAAARADLQYRQVLAELGISH